MRGWGVISSKASLLDCAPRPECKLHWLQAEEEEKRQQLVKAATVESAALFTCAVEMGAPQTHIHSPNIHTCARTNRNETHSHLAFSFFSITITGSVLQPGVWGGGDGELCTKLCLVCMCGAQPRHTVGPSALRLAAWVLGLTQASGSTEVRWVSSE